MKILLTGANGYIGKRLLPLLIRQGHEIVCCVRDKNRFPTEGFYEHPNISIAEIDFLNDIPDEIPFNNIDVAYYLPSFIL